MFILVILAIESLRNLLKECIYCQEEGWNKKEYIDY